MKNKLIPILSIVSFLSLYSCAPVYKCGEERPERGISGSNRLLDVVKERDELCDMLESKEQETTYLIKRNQELTLTNDSLDRKVNEIQQDRNKIKAELNTLQDKHDELRNDHLLLSQKFSDEISKNLSQGHLYDERIKEKERRLQLKEEELAKNERAVAEREKRIKELENELERRDSIAKRLNQLLHEALLGFNSDELSTEIKDGKVYVSMSDKLMFQSGRADVQQKGKEALELLADVLNKNKSFQIAVEGHTDNVPISTSRYADNWDLSVDRATSIVRILQKDFKVDPLRLTASGKGEYFPKADNSTAEGRAKNRRTEIILSPNLEVLMNLLGD